MSSIAYLQRLLDLSTAPTRANREHFWEVMHEEAYSDGVVEPVVEIDSD